MIVLIDNYDSFTFNLYQYMAELGATVRVYRNDVLTVDAVRAMQPEAVVISPGPGRPEHAGICPELVRQLDGVIPILGICLGHQVIGHVYNMSVTSAPALVHGKSSEIRHDAKALFSGLPETISVGRYHSLIVSDKHIPDQLIVSARNVADGIIMGIRHRQHITEGIQFHPESLLTPDGKHMLQNFLGMLPTSGRGRAHQAA